MAKYLWASQIILQFYKQVYINIYYMLALSLWLKKTSKNTAFDWDDHMSAFPGTVRLTLIAPMSFSWYPPLHYLKRVLVWMMKYMVPLPVVKLQEVSKFIDYRRNINIREKIYYSLSVSGSQSPSIKWLPVTPVAWYSCPVESHLLGWWAGPSSFLIKNKT